MATGRGFFQDGLARKALRTSRFFSSSPQFETNLNRPRRASVASTKKALLFPSEHTFIGFVSRTGTARRQTCLYFVMRGA